MIAFGLNENYRNQKPFYNSNSNHCFEETNDDTLAFVSQNHMGPIHQVTGLKQP